MRFFALFLLIPSIAHGHVRLVFPAPRQPAFDSHFSQNSKLPCGVPKPGLTEGHRTFLQAGTTVEIQWDSAAPHVGGIRLEVLNALDEPIALFVNFNEPFNISETTRTVELPPKFECANCAIRLTQSMSELSPEAMFVTCGDINILNAIPDGDSCLGRGTRKNGKCQCEKNFSGEQCQKEVECLTSSDCGPSAECRTSLLEPTRQCFCPQGAFGETCQFESSIDLSNSINESLYQKREDQGNEIMWRIVDDEIEMVLRYPGSSWVAVGWKPLNYPCFDMSSELATKQISNTIDKAVATEEKDLGDDCGMNEVWSECPEMSRECEASCDWTKFPETIPNCPRTCAQPRCVCKEGYVRKSNEDNTCVVFEYCDKEAEPQCGANSTWAKCGTACEPTCANMYDTAPCPASCDKPACTCADNYVRLNDACIYWGDCPEVERHIKEDNNNGESVTTPIPRVNATNSSTKFRTTEVTRAPMITQRRIVPRQCAVNETFNECGRICEADCVSIFTRTECDGCGSADCACIQGYARNRQGQCVYWGDCPVEGTNFETRAPSTTTTKAPVTISSAPKVNGDVCYGDWRYPAGCKDCQYKLSWNYVEDNDTVEFSLETRITGNSWTGVGISPGGTMIDSDMLIVKSENGKLSVEDAYSEGYGRPIRDVVQNVEQNVVGTHANGVLRAQFSRLRNTADSWDKRLDTECYYFLFPVEGGKLDSSGNITAHTSLPLVSNRKICIRSCANPKETAAETVAAPTVQQKITEATSQQAPSAKCDTSYSYPEGCSGDACEYEAKWDYDTKRGDVRFEIRSKNVGRWTGIGFSKTGEMAYSDVYTGWVYEGKAYMTDRFSYGRQLPAIDPQDRQDVYNISGKVENDHQTLIFHRKLKTPDTSTDYPLDKCYFFLYPIGGGRVLARKSSDFSVSKTPIGYHDLYEPKSSAKKICLCDENGNAIAKDDGAKTRVRVVKRQAPLPPSPQQKLPLRDAMSCTDMTVAFVEDSRVRLRDFYSPSQASPMPDQKLGGSDSLTDAAGYQKDGVTTVIFRKKITASDKFDHTITNSPMTVIWAKGPEITDYVHMIPSKEDKEPSFFQRGAFRYHGKNKRGVMTINFLDDHSEPKGETVHGMQIGASTCQGRISLPENCIGSGCMYSLEWKSDGQVARFTVRSRLELNKWTAVGFSMDGGMAASDVVIIGVQKDMENMGETLVTVTDQFMPGYGRPTVDEQQDIFDVETSFIDGVLNANFSRELHSEDTNDVDLKECVYLLYSPHGGRIETNGEIRKHGETPLASRTKICLDTCKEMKEETVRPAPTTIKSTTRIVEVPQTEVTEEAEETTTTTERRTKTTTISTTQTKTTTPKSTTSEIPEKKGKPSEPHIAVVYVPDEDEQVRGRYGLRVRILNREFTEALRDTSSEYHQSLTKEVVAAVNKLLADRWKGLQVSKILGYSKGSVIADFEVISTKDTPRPIEVKSLIEENAVRGAINGLRIEPSTVRTTMIDDEPAETNIEKAAVDPSLTRNIIIISICVLLLAMTILCCCCLMCRVRRTSHRFDSYPIPHPTGMHPYGHIGPAPNGKGKGFENAAFAMRQHSHSTSSSKPGSPSGNGSTGAVVNGNNGKSNGSSSATNPTSGPTNDSVERAPEGMGETTYKEWFDKVGSKPASQHVEESLASPSRGPPTHPTQPYVSYPNDPSGYYTLGGEHRVGQPPPRDNNGAPRYFRPF